MWVEFNPLQMGGHKPVEEITTLCKEPEEEDGEEEEEEGRKGIRKGEEE